MNKYIVRLIIIMLFFVCYVPVFADSVMDRIEKSGKLKVGFRKGAYPFAFSDSTSGKHIGFSVDMATILARFLSLHFSKEITVVPVSITPDKRIPYIINDKIDVEMGSSTYTQLRESIVDFSVIFFVSETTFLVPVKANIRTVYELNGKRVGGAAGTSNLASMEKLIEDKFLVVDKLLKFSTHDDGMSALVAGQIDAYVTDRTLLEGLRLRDDHPEQWLVLDAAIAYDPYAYILKEGNSDFRDFINNTLKWSITSGEFFEIYDKWLGPKSRTPIKLSPSMKEYLNIIAYPMAEDWYLK